jgi:hypothetical protein
VPQNKPVALDFLAVPLPQGTLALEAESYLLQYDEEISRPFASRKIYRPEDVLTLPALEQQRLRSEMGLLDKQFKDLYQDNQLFGKSRKFIEYLTTDRIEHKERRAILEMFRSLTNGLADFSGEQLLFFTWLQSSTTRWERLMGQLGQAAIAPQKIRLFRGMHGENAKAVIRALLEAWDLGNNGLSVPQNPLASWAFRLQAAQHFATDFGKSNMGVVFGGDIPIQQIHATKLTDGGNFLPWWNQYEAIVGSLNREQRILAHPKLCSVYWQGIWYTSADLVALKAVTQGLL